jgi:hypothetical protein
MHLFCEVRYIIFTLIGWGVDLFPFYFLALRYSYFCNVIFMKKRTSEAVVLVKEEKILSFQSAPRRFEGCFGLGICGLCV